MKNIAIMGGTFNPIHIGHLIAAQCTSDHHLFDEIWFMPSGNPPHKEGEVIIDSAHRMEMCRIATKDHPTFRISDYELNRKGKVYSVDTFAMLQKEFPDNKYWLIIGTDSLFNLEKWYNHKKLLKIGAFVIVHRSGYDEEKSLEQQARLRECYHTAFMNVHMPQIEVSSSMIRKRIAEGKPINYYVPDAVSDYIQKHKLYQLGDDYEIH
ncbi:MAG: nicotinate-nucleotide adenylyltransferase [Firmicutes bacterium HGW-Firmicutes-2]|jgi:nicotinate-nucleotide adenylyltransferase|nr:MAG: nicotinate-nucleotide adenylyltransferase [Firmicutes bacterium HGW-Firmicutes-2]